jgi:hypothetical protein
MPILSRQAKDNPKIWVEELSEVYGSIVSQFFVSAFEKALVSIQTTVLYHPNFNIIYLSVLSVYDSFASKAAPWLRPISFNRGFQFLARQKAKGGPVCL